MNMHVCGILPTAGKKWAAKTFGGLFAVQNGERVEREKVGGLFAAGRSMNMHVRGILPTAGKKLAAQKFGGLTAAGRPMNIAQNGKRMEREWAG